jgi:hypothetical protein
MVKFFPTMPAILELFNPDAPTKAWFGKKTFDENGELHSYNDMPIYSYEGIQRKGILKFKPSLPLALKPWQAVWFSWYSHGKLYREGNKPARIQIMGKQYSAYDSEHNLHSYNGMPAKITLEDNDKEFRLEWFDHGLEHREGDLPSSVMYDVEGVFGLEMYKKHGVEHRNNNLPSRITAFSKTWTVEGYLHSITGASYIDDRETKNMWALYGITFSKTKFDQIKAAANKNMIPAWAAFLLTFNLITQDHLIPFVDDEGKWNTLLPTSWVLHCWGITEETFQGKEKEKKWGYSSARNHYKSFMTVITSEEKFASEAAKKEKTNA